MHTNTSLLVQHQQATQRKQSFLNLAAAEFHADVAQAEKCESPHKTEGHPLLPVQQFVQTCCILSGTTCRVNDVPRQHSKHINSVCPIDSVALYLLAGIVRDCVQCNIAQALDQCVLHLKSFASKINRRCSCLCPNGTHEEVHTLRGAM